MLALPEAASGHRCEGTTVLVSADRVRLKAIVSDRNSLHHLAKLPRRGTPRF